MNKLYSFMSGRNGNDQLGIGMLVLALVLNIIYSMTGEGIFSSIATVLLILAVYRMFSRDLVKRRAENRKFMSLWSNTKKDLAGKKTRLSQSKEYKFFTCSSCKNVLRVPRGKGKIQITCPKCGQRFSGKS